MEISGQSKRMKVKIKSGDHNFSKYAGQICSAIVYFDDIGNCICNAQLNTEELKPPIPKYQSIKNENIEIISQEEMENWTYIIG